MFSVCVCVRVDRIVILGGHRDAWVFGGIDPVTGASATHETVRAAGKLLQKGLTHTHTHNAINTVIPQYLHQ